jgi:predicted RNA binding protein YcfA (HicA-like mRNA interferase family)
MQMTIGAPGEEAAHVGPCVLPDDPVNRVRKAATARSSWSVASQVSATNGGDFMLDHDPTVRSPRLAANVARSFDRLARGPAAEVRTRASTDSVMPCLRGMAKAARMLAALKRDGWIETRRSGSHRVMLKGDQQRIWAYHDGVDLGGPALARIARDYGYTVDELRKL